MPSDPGREGMWLHDGRPLVSQSHTDPKLCSGCVWVPASSMPEPEAVTAVQRRLPAGWTAVAYDDGRWAALSEDGQRVGAADPMELLDAVGWAPLSLAGRARQAEEPPAPARLPLLRWPLLVTTNSRRAEGSRFVWAPYPPGSRNPWRWSLSLLGIINGLLPGGWKLVDVVDELPGGPPTAHIHSIAGRAYQTGPDQGLE